MMIYTTVAGWWDGTRYVVDNDLTQSLEYTGPVALCCGASNAQNQLQDQQMSAYQTMSDQAKQVFGDSSTTFGDLMKSFAPTVAAGPSQEGYSAAEKSNLNSQAITQTGQSYKNAKEAVGDAVAAQGGGNTSGTTAGSNVGISLDLAEKGASQTAGELGKINEDDYATGRQNYDTAVKGMESAPGVFGASTSAGGAATDAGKAATDTANQIASQDNSWVQSVTGALGGIAGMAVTGGMSNLGKH